jgi:hypothetical protein
VASADEDPKGAIKGFICASFAEWTHAQLGEAFFRRGLMRVSADDLDGLSLATPDLGIVPIEWYGASRMHRILEALTAELGDEEKAKMSAIAGRYIFERQMTGLQRALFSLLLTPTRYVKHASKAWRSNFTNGELEFETGPDFHRCVYRAWHAHHPLICKMMMHGKLAVYRAMGMKRARVEVVRCADGDGCDSIVRW